VRPPMKAYSLEDVPHDILKKWYSNLLDRHHEGRNDRHLGWWISNNAATVTITTHLGHTFTATGAGALAAIDTYIAQQDKAEQWRGA
jgi:hypothetical protein